MKPGDPNRSNKSTHQQLVESLLDEVKRQRDWSFNWQARNALASIGTSAVPRLIEALKDEDGYVREVAANALGKIGDKKAIEPLVCAMRYRDGQVYQDGEDCEARTTAATALGEIGDRSVVGPLVQTLGDTLRNDGTLSGYIIKVLDSLGELQQAAPLLRESVESSLKDDATLAWHIIDALGKLRDSRVVPLLIKILDHADIDVHKSARSALVQIGQPAVPALIEVLLDKNIKWRASAANALKKIGDQRAFEPFINVLKDRSADEYVRWEAAQALGKSGSGETLELLVNTLADKQEPELVRRGAATGLGLSGDNRAYEPLIEALADAGTGLRWDLTQALGDLGDSRAVELLVSLLQDENWQVREKAAEALGKTGDERIIPVLFWVVENDSETIPAFSDRVKTAAAAAIDLIRKRQGPTG
ncbi:MAG TPA: HEAT repeat domain-containing protein [Blastocatellia bacterium]|nr:HEAT repeat domain-containing protein [Blastocatellia bacterium]